MTTETDNNRRHWRFIVPNTILTKMLFSYGIIFLCLALVITTIIVQITESIRNQIIRNNNATLSSINLKIDSYIKEIDYISTLFYTSESGMYVNEAMFSDHYSYEYTYAKQKILLPYQLMKSISRVSGDIEGVIFLDNEGQVYISDILEIKKDPSDVVASDVFTKTIDAHGRLCINIIDSAEWLIRSDAAGISQPSYVCISRKLINTYGSNPLGMLMLMTPMDRFAGIFKSSISDEPSRSIVIFDKDGSLIYTSRPDLVSDAGDLGQLSPAAYEDSVNTIAYSDWSCHILTDRMIAYNELHWVIFISVGSAIVFALVAAFMSIRLSRKVYQSANEIYHFSRNIKKGKLDERLGKTSTYEFKIAYEALNSMAAKLDDTIKKNLVLTIATQESELRALQSQINPHFMYNTLNAINACARMKRIDQLTDMINALSDIMRYSLGSSNKMVTVAEEISHIDNFLLIQNIRFNNSIEVVKEIDPGLLTMQISALLLQPLVENAVYHGLNEKEGQRSLKIIGRLEHDTCKFMIIDNGIGFEESKLRKIQEILASDDILQSMPEVREYGLGVLNVHLRIRTKFGSPYGLEVQSAENIGTTITVALPARTMLEGR